jgi:hypothetical protein
MIRRIGKPLGDTYAKVERPFLSKAWNKFSGLGVECNQPPITESG